MSTRIDTLAAPMPESNSDAGVVPVLRKPLGTLLILHGLAHSLAGMRATEGAHPWGMTVVWSLALVGFTAAGLVLLGTRGLGRSWRRFAMLGVLGSVVLLTLGWAAHVAVLGLVIDAIIVALLVTSKPLPTVNGPIAVRDEVLAMTDIIAITALFCLGVLVVARPWYMRWGSSPVELTATLPGDSSDQHATYQIQHAISIHAPPDRVWPWLAQLGEERGGFYSYEWLERLCGLHIHNADRIHPEWQRLAAGDTVFATHVGWLGLRRRLGWRIGLVQPETVMVLEGWGAFVLLPTAQNSTRLIVRTRGEGPDGFAAVAMAPFGFVVFEPAHFIMQRRMLLTIKRLAEEEVLQHGPGHR